MTFAYGVKVTRQRAGELPDPYSAQNTQADWGNTVDEDFEGCAVWQEPSTETVPVGAELRTQVITVTKVTVPYDADITPKDRFVVNGNTYKVVGEIQRYRHPMTGWEPGAVVTGRWISG